MSPGQRKTPGGGTRGFQISAYSTDQFNVQSTRIRPAKRTQKEKVLARLEQGWTCGSTWLELRMPRATARIWELKQEGVVVIRRTCQNPNHYHESPQFEWRIPPEFNVALPGMDMDDV